MDAGSAAMLRRAFDETAVKPEEITFLDGDRAYLEELVRSSFHPGRSGAWPQAPRRTTRVSGTRIDFGPIRVEVALSG